MPSKVALLRENYSMEFDATNQWWKLLIIHFLANENFFEKLRYPRNNEEELLNKKYESELRLFYPRIEPHWVGP